METPKVRAKFKVSRLERTMGTKAIVEEGKTSYVPAELHTVTLVPVYGNGDPNHENTKFWTATPCGEIKLGVINAAAQFELDREYYVDFTPA